jgi:hypothetical protein
MMRLAEWPRLPEAQRAAMTSGGLRVSFAPPSLADSATSTSPFGSVYSQRGRWSPVAKSETVNPGGAAGVRPSGHGTTREKRVAEAVVSGAGRRGLGPKPVPVTTPPAAGPGISAAPTLAPADALVSR